MWIHGLTSDVLEGAPLFREIAEEFAARLDGPGARRAQRRLRLVDDRPGVRARGARRRRSGSGCAPSRCPRSWGCRCPTTSWSRSPRTSASCSSGRTTRWTTRACWPRRSGRVCTRAARDGVRLPLLECRPLTEWSDSPATPRIGYQAGCGYGGYGPAAGGPRASGPPAPTPTRGGTSRAGRSCRACGWRSPGDTSVDRELLEDRADRGGAARRDERVPADQPAGHQRPGLRDVEGRSRPVVRHAGRRRGGLHPAAAGCGRPADGLAPEAVPAPASE